MGKGGKRLGKLRLLQADLRHGGGQRRLVALDACQRRRDARRRLLRVLDGAEAGFCQIGVTLALLLRESLVGMVNQDRGLGGFGVRPLDADRRLLAGDHRMGGSDIGTGLVERHRVVAGVNAREHLARLYRLVVADEHLAQVARHLRRYRDGVGLDIGVVGRDIEAADQPVVPAEIGAASKDDETGTKEEEPPQAARLGSWRLCPGLVHPSPQTGMGLDNCRLEQGQRFSLRVAGPSIGGALSQGCLIAVHDISTCRLLQGWPCLKPAAFPLNRKQHPAIPELHCGSDGRTSRMGLSIG